MNVTLEQLAHKADRLLNGLSDELRQWEFRETEKKACQRYGRKKVAKFLAEYAGDRADSLFDVIFNRKPR